MFKSLKSPRPLIMRDGIHLTDMGHQMMASLLAKLLGPSLSDERGQAPLPGTGELTAHARSVLVAHGVE